MENFRRFSSAVECYTSRHSRIGCTLLLAGGNLGQGDWENKVRAALLGDQDNPRLLAALGGLRLQAGDVEQALVLLERAMLLAPDEPQILCDYGAVLTTAGRLEQAESLLRSGVMVFSDDNLRFNLARCHQLQGKTDEALAVLASMEHRSDDAFKLEGDLLKGKETSPVPWQHILRR
ncbi:MAG: tetratricopeptide repeat protein [Betaproteobacteria bacterium]|uniref:Tetratricopeptide repeat protein n=1 Tax=Candidatus Proximibacter danicus TaxID=2954365 RepID=A0A9D7K1L7_9PROT|nr:tetratricopeptide repeat protein [Candidatus Proximibacter danicus]